MEKKKGIFGWFGQERESIAGSQTNAGDSLQFCEIEGASLVYYFDEKENCYIIEEIASNQPGKGKVLVEVFAKKIGPNKRVKFQGVIERETNETLARQGVLQHIERTSKRWETNNYALFRSLKITRMILGGGLKIERMVFFPFEAAEKTAALEVGDMVMISIDVYART
jgi:hypothetical protein